MKSHVPPAVPLCPNTPSTAGAMQDPGLWRRDHAQSLPQAHPTHEQQLGRCAVPMEAVHRRPAALLHEQRRSHAAACSVEGPMRTWLGKAPESSTLTSILGMSSQQQPSLSACCRASWEACLPTVVLHGQVFSGLNLCGAVRLQGGAEASSQRIQELGSVLLPAKLEQRTVRSS